MNKGKGSEIKRSQQLFKREVDIIIYMKRNEISECVHSFKNTKIHPLLFPCILQYGRNRKFEMFLGHLVCCVRTEACQAFRQDCEFWSRLAKISSGDISTSMKEADLLSPFLE